GGGGRGQGPGADPHGGSAQGAPRQRRPSRPVGAGPAPEARAVCAGAALPLESARGRSSATRGDTRLHGPARLLLEGEASGPARVRRLAVATQTKTALITGAGSGIGQGI